MQAFLRYFAWPLGWSAQSKSFASIGLSIALLFVGLYSLATPLSWAPEPIGNNAQVFAEGTRVTVLLTVVAGVAGLLIGLGTALAKLSRYAALRTLAGFYIWVIRGTPLLVQVLFVYLALPLLIPAFQFSDFNSACIALSFNAGAYNAEALRSGFLAVPKGQVEAAHSLGLSKWHTFYDVVFPQAFKIALPALVNNTVALLKDSSLAYAIGVVELTNVGNRIQAATFQPVPTLVTTAIIYLSLTTIVTRMSNALERLNDVEGRLL
jgi:polar amino acid transport system permease protein